MKNIVAKFSSERVYVFGLGLGVLYGLLVALIPLSGLAVERPDRPDHDAVREEVNEQICADYDLSRCGGEQEGGDGGSGGDGGTGGGGDGGSGGGGGADQDAITFVLRTPEGVAYETSYTLPSNETTVVRSTNGIHRITVPAKSALASLVAIDELSRAFAITDLVYFPSFDSFYLHCLEVRGKGDLCGSWQYSVNGSYPSVGLDDQVLAGGDTFHLYFGAMRLVEAPETVTSGSSFVALAKRYDVTEGGYVPAGGLTIGITRSNPDDPWAPVVVATAQTGADGKATFVAPAAGKYELGIKEDGYYPSTPLTVVAAGATAGGTGGGGGGMLLRGSGGDVFDVDAALRFLTTQQETNGTFGAPIYTDWAAIAFAAAGTNTQVVREYLKKETDSVTSLTDHERRAMALMALGVDPYSGTSIDHVAAIRAEFKDGQFGDPKRVNDDIFALIVLERVGYRVGDAQVDGAIASVLRAQATDGAWDASVDLTAAAIQALVPYRAASGVEGALLKAESYLRKAQKSDGGFGDAFATAWVLQAIDVLGDSPNDWAVGGNTPLTYLARAQQTDGGVLTATEATSTRVWVTAYAIPAALGMSWREVLHVFSARELAMAEARNGARTSSTTNTSDIAPTFSSGAASSTDAAYDLESWSSATTSASSTNESDVATKTDSPDQTATAAAAGGLSDTLRLLALGFLAVLVGYAVFRFRLAK